MIVKATDTIKGKNKKKPQPKEEGLYEFTNATT